MQIHFFNRLDIVAAIGSCSQPLRRSLHPLLLALGFCLGVLAASAQLPGARDTQFVTLSGTDIHPTSLAVAEDGTLFAGGSFTNYGGAGYAGITRLLSDGRQDPFFLPVALRAVVEARVLTNIGIVTNLTIIPGSTNRGVVTGLALFPDHRVAVVGEFNDVNHQRSTGFVTLTTSGLVAGTADVKLWGMEPRGVLSSFSRRVFIYGHQSLDPNPTNAAPGLLPIAEVDSSGGRMGSFVPPRVADLGAYSAFVTHLLSGPTNTLYAFVSVGVSNGPGRFEILRLHESGNLDLSFAAGGRAEVSKIDEAFARVSPQGELYISGPFTYRGAFYPGPLHRIRLDGTLDSSFVADIPVTSQPYVGVEPDGNLVMFGLALPEFMVRLRPDGSRDRGYRDPVVVPTPATIVTQNLRMGPDGSAFLMGTLLAINGAQFQFDHGIIRVHGGQLRLAYAVVNGSLGLTWPAGFRLQRTASLVSPSWVDLTAATSPWTVPTSASSDFYRIIAP